MRSYILGAGELLDANGVLCESGYAYKQVKRYARTAIKGSKLRIKEWDYYCFGNDTFMIALTVADNSYMSLASVSVLDFRHLKYITKSKIGLLSKGNLCMPQDCSNGNVSFDKSGVSMSFEIGEDGTRKLKCSYKKYHEKRDFRCEIELAPPIGDNITVAVPFAKKRQFYYNTKVNCLKGKGWFELGDERHEIDGLGVLDWGRGVWPFKNKWYWSSLSCELDGGTQFGLNLGYGFGQPTATENVIFYDGNAHKLNEVLFDIPFTKGQIDYLKPWKISDGDERLDIMFYPMIDRMDHMRVFNLMTDQHQVFGKFYGKATLDDGTIVTLNDKIGFAECVRNQW